MHRAEIMAHMVAWYPDRERSLEVAAGLIDGGVSYLEVQFPFSDPTADGPVIQGACSAALEAGFSLEDGFSLVRDITAGTTVPVFIMSYASPVVARGVGQFVRRAREAGVTGLIIPDLMPGQDEGLYREGREEGLQIVPVVVPSMKEHRLECVQESEPGLTGAETDLAAVTGFLERLASFEAHLLAGFGISRREQVEMLAPYVDGVVIGSAFVRTVTEALTLHSHSESLYEAVKQKASRFVFPGYQHTVDPKLG
jgi:tryptophan synthase alpha chain